MIKINNVEIQLIDIESVYNLHTFV